MTTDDTVAYVDSIHQRSGHGHLHLRSTDECLHREAGERCPTWRERAERAEAALARVEALAGSMEMDARLLISEGEMSYGNCTSMDAKALRRALTGNVATDPACTEHDGRTPVESRGKSCPACLR